MSKPQLMANCGNCAFYMREPGKPVPAQSLCRAHSPQVVMVGLAQRSKLAGIPEQAPQPITHTVFPSMRKEGWCGDWAPTAQMEGAFIDAANERAA